MRAINTGDELLLVHEPDNQFDANAIRVLVETKEMIGYLDRDYARILAPLIDEGITLKATVSRQLPLPTIVFPLGRLFVNAIEE